MAGSLRLAWRRSDRFTACQRANKSADDLALRLLDGPVGHMIRPLVNLISARSVVIDTRQFRIQIHIIARLHPWGWFITIEVLVFLLATLAGAYVTWMQRSSKGGTPPRV